MVNHGKSQSRVQQRSATRALVSSGAENTDDITSSVYALSEEPVRYSFALANKTTQSFGEFTMTNSET